MDQKFSYECENQSFTYNFLVLEETTNNIYVVDARNSTASTSTRTVGVQLNSAIASQDPASPNIASINANTVTPWPTVNYWTLQRNPPLPDDVSLLSIDGPNSGCSLTATETASVTISNPGLNTQTSIPVEYSLNGGPFVSAGTWTGSLASNATTTHTFTVDLSAVQTHDLVVVTNLAADTDNKNDTASRAIINAPLYAISDTVSVCSGDDFTFPDGTMQTNITANTMHTSNLSTVAFSCDSIITTSLEVTPIYNLTDAATVCVGDTFVFPDGSMETNITAQVIQISNLTTAGFGCDSIITTTVDVAPVDSTIDVAGTTITANESGATYRWLDCNDNFQMVAGETNQSYTATMNGSYAVEITNSNGCVDTSECTSFTTIGIADNAFGNSVQLYPNPTTGLITIDLGERYQLSQLEILNLQGQQIFAQQIENKQLIQLEIDQPKGTYLLQIRNKEGVYREKIVIN